MATAPGRGSLAARGAVSSLCSVSLSSVSRTVFSASVFVLFLQLASPATAQEGVWITEFLAVNDDGRRDEDGDRSDWIELQNVGTSSISLGGWYLTDDPLDLFRWRLPAVTLDAGEYLVVVASGKDRAIAGSELHASFALAGDGGYLALVRPDGTIEHEYAPEYPPQRADYSYGIAQSVETTTLVGEGATARYRVPSSGADALAWTLPGYDDSAWGSGPMGIGHDSGAEVIPGPDGPVNLAPLGTATQSSQLGGFAPGFAIDGDFGNFTHTAAGDNLPATWQLDLAEPYSLQSIVLHNRTSCCGSRLRDITIVVLDRPEGDPVYESDLLNPENVLGGGGLNGPGDLTVDFVEERGGPVTGRIIQVIRTPDPDLSGSGGGGNNDEADVLSLGEVEVFEGIAGYSSEIATDIEDEMLGVNASAYVRIPFDAPNLGAFDTLTLRIKYDDGFVAYLNGREVARRNAPASPTWSSNATAEHPDDAAIQDEDIGISDHIGILALSGNVLAIHGLNASAGDNDFLISAQLIGRSFEQDVPRWFRRPTPGLPNDTDSIVGFVADTTFSVDRGFYEEPFEVEIATATEAAVIRYTLDGTMPTRTHGTRYAGAIPIDRTTVLRAAAFRDGFEPTNVDAQTYIFLGDVVRQTSAATIAAGFPTSWNGTSPDYGMDSDVVGPGDRYGGKYARTIQDDLRAVPTISIVMNLDDMFGSSGIYSNPGNRGSAWERPASFEIIYPDGRDGFQVNCGIRIQGGAFRSHGLTKKKSLRLLFKGIYGATKLRFPLFGPEASDRLDTITLRANNNDGWQWDGAGDSPLYIRDSFGRQTILDMDGVASHELFAHVYINGFYWGLYDAVERPDASFSATYFGGDKDDWDSISNSSASNGNLNAWNQLLSLVRGAATTAGYQRVQGNFPDGTINPDYPNLIDVRNFADYMINNLWVGNTDWPNKNYWMGRDRANAGPDGGFKFYMWDSEWSMGIRSDLNTNQVNVSVGIAEPWPFLKQNPEFRVLVGDRIHRHLFNGGVFYVDADNARWDPARPDRNRPAARFMQLADQVDRAVVAESARWGDQHASTPYTRDEHWQRERDQLLASYFPARSARVLEQFRAAGLYPNLAAPTFNVHGGLVPEGFGVVASAPVGEVWITVDGSDPRLPGGDVSPTAFVGGAVDGRTILGTGAQARILVPLSGALGLEWTQPEYEDGAWLAGPTGVGFETATGYEDHIATSLEAVMHDVNSTAYLRVPFELEDPRAVAFLLLRMKYDDGYVAYINGVEVASKNAPANPEWDSRATSSHSDLAAVVFETIDISVGVPHLRAGRNVLAIHGLNTSPGGGDFLIVPELDVAEAADGLVVDQSAVIRARARNGGEWSALTEATFIVDVPLRVSEIMFHPPDPLVEGFPGEEYEFLELLNIGEEPVSLDGLTLAGGIAFDFSAGDVRSVPPGGVVLVVRNVEAFASRYDAAGLLIAGEYDGNLGNAGDSIELRGPFGEKILGFRYDDRWYPEADGLGLSLVHVDPRGGDPAAWGAQESWRLSESVLGSPGVDETRDPNAGGGQLVGDANQDGVRDLSDAVTLLRRLFLGLGGPLPCEGDGLADGGNLRVFDANSDARVDISDAVYLLEFLFLGGPAPVPEGCIQIRGCADRCRFGA